MSRNDYAPDLRAALDAFTVTEPRGDFADRIMAATTPVVRPATRDRRGSWKLARRAIIGTVAAGMVSAAAVASGLLGAAGIRVPVLTAMLAPEPAPKPVTKARKPVVRVAAVPAAKPAVVATAPATLELGGSMASDDRRTQIDAAISRRAERRMERRAFIRQNPELRPVIRQALKNEQAFVRSNPQVHELRRLPRAERAAFLAERPDLQAAMRARQAERRAFREANPQAAATIRARIEQRRAMRVAPVDPADEGNIAAPR
jgi:hypothetical protein